MTEDARTPGNGGPSLTCEESHFMGRCLVCDCRYVKAMTLEQVESWYYQGCISYVVFAAYMHVWSTSSFHYSSLGVGWEAEPAAPEVKQAVSFIKS